MGKFDACDNLDEILQQFQHLNQVLIDASSIIYTVKAGYFHCVTKSLRLYAPKNVIEETRYQDLIIHSLAAEDEDLSPDESLVQSAAQLRWPVITEDLGIIRQLAEQKATYFNALMILEYVFFRKLVTQEEYAGYLQKLLDYAWYSSEVTEFGKSFHRVLLGEGRCL